MAYPGKRTGPRRDFKSRDYGARDGMRPELHSAVCADCGNDCQVPFKPNGKKPVLCGNCFKKDGGPRESRDSKPWERGNDRPSFGDRRPQRAPREDFRGGSNGNDQVAAQLKAINEKLDALIAALSEAQ